MALHHMPQPQPSPTPERFFHAVNSFQIAAALKAAVELDLFTAIHEGATTPAELAVRLHSDSRRVRILCDFLVTEELLEKDDGRYWLTPDSEMFLVRTSPAYLGGTLGFLLHPDQVSRFDGLADIVRHGVASGEAGLVAEDHLWVQFARSMAPLMHMPAEAIAGELGADRGQAWKVLDIAAGHGIFGITVARHNPNARIVAVDWPGVLQVAKENAAKFGVATRYSTLPGSAFEVDFGTGYDVVLLTNFLHHFDPATNVQVLKKIYAALKPGGRVVTLEFVPDENRVSPPAPARFALIMLAGTPSGDSYPYSAFQRMFREAGFASTDLVQLPHPESLIIARR